MSGDYEVMELRARVMELEGKVEFLYKHLNIEYVKEASESDRKVLEAVKKGNLIEGIKVYRDIYQVDLATAKKAVEELMRK